MTADRWKQVSNLYHAALERPANERAEFLAHACDDDPELRREIESLLRYEAASDNLVRTITPEQSDERSTAEA